VKRKALIKDLVKGGCYLKRHGGRHDIYANPRNGKKAPIPRHPEIKDSLVRLIKRQLGI
jgi:predicted RNA binding protein YcfA (HicA-like mRNA interferase family)